MISQTLPEVTYHDGQQIGKSHTLVVSTGSSLQVKRHGQRITVQITPTQTLVDPSVVKAVRAVTREALRIEAKSYLPKRLAYLAAQGGFTYEKVRFSHASSRWGSCSSTGTISLNIALMKLPFALIDYVIIHELAHTVELNHSEQFWRLVEQGDSQYKLHRRQLKQETPAI